MKFSKSPKNIILITLAALLLCSVPTFAQTSLWKISKGDDYLYLGGTVHILPQSAFPLPEAFEQAYQQADVVVLETELPDLTDNQTQFAMLQKLSYSGGNKLSKVLSPEVYLELSGYFKKFNIPLAQLDGFKPGFMMIQIAALEIQKANLAGEGVDIYFSNKAKTDNKPLAYLETFDFQIGLVSELGTGYEDNFIRMNLDQIDTFADVLNKVIAAWRIGDIAAMEELVILPTKIDERIYQDMFTQRNKNWLPLIEQMFGNDQRELVLVGVGHMAGEDNILALLRKAGYSVEQLRSEYD